MKEGRKEVDYMAINRKERPKVKPQQCDDTEMPDSLEREPRCK